MPLEIRRLFTIVDEKLSEDGHADGGPPLRRVAAVAVVVNPLAGAQEHVNGLADDHLRRAAAPGRGRRCRLDLLLHQARRAGGEPRCTAAHKDALYVHSHYDGMTLTLPDAPQGDEITLVVVLANRGRIGERVGGLGAEAIEGRDGLR
jgi:hypothetical protein